MSSPLTSRLQRLLKVLESDIRDRVSEDAALRAPLRADYDLEFAAKATRQDFLSWLEGRITQSSVAWILATVFVRFLEDNALITPPRFLAPVQSADNSPAERWEVFIAAHPTGNRRDWMQAEFRELARLPALADLLGEENAHLWALAPSQDGVMSLLNAFSERTADGATLLWPFKDADLATRFLGDLYQDLSEDAKNRYALLQTPDFVERFILDHTLEPALDTFGVHYLDEDGGFRLIDPTVGSGHFLLGAFSRILRRWQLAEPATDIRVLVQRTLDSLYGVDVNPFAVSIARFRLVVAALKACAISSLADCPDFRVPLAAGDSLLLRVGEGLGTQGVQLSLDRSRDSAAAVVVTHPRYDMARRLLAKRFHAVVGNPPYIQPPSDLRDVYRSLYGSCYREFALTSPFMERFVELALASRGTRPAGFVGKITSNSFMKKEFGKRLVTNYFPKWDLTAAVDTSGAYIPEHGTPTVVLFFRNQAPSKTTVRSVLGIRGEPSTPADPAEGLVWQAILELFDRPGSQNMFVSVEERDRGKFVVHPWSLSGGGAGDVQAVIEGAGTPLGELVSVIGSGAVPRADDAYLIGDGAGKRAGIPAKYLRRLVEGDTIRDWGIWNPTAAIWPYSEDTLECVEDSAISRRLWPLRTQLSDRVAFGQTQLERGLRWFEYSMFFKERFRSPLSIAFPEIATHGHFVIDRGDKIFKHSAPMIKLKSEANENDHLALVGVLNSSTALFFCKQVCHNKGGGGIGGGLASERWEKFTVFSATSTGLVPIPSERAQVIPVSTALDELAQGRVAAIESLRTGPIQTLTAFARLVDENLLEMVALQEELDWLAYRLYGFRQRNELEASSVAGLPAVALGQRAFEIVMARQMREGKLQTSWFERHGSTPTTEIPKHWPEAYQALVERRIAAIESEPSIALIEQPEFKRRWNHEDSEKIWRAALTSRLLDHAEALQVWRSEQPEPMSVGRIADLMVRDQSVVQIAEYLTGQEAPDFGPFFADLLAVEHVPVASGARYRSSGLSKRRAWEETWELQRKEDAIAALATAGSITAEEARVRRSREVGDIPVPPKYTNKDFRSPAYWQARGKLDVPKERFLSYPLAGGQGKTGLMLGWAGWDHFQQAQALVGLIQSSEESGAGSDQLLPLLQGLGELLPWLSQWYGNHPEFGDLGAVFRQAWLDAIARAGLTTDAVLKWTLP